MNCIEQLYRAHVEASEKSAAASISPFLHDDAVWHVAHPIEPLHGSAAISNGWLAPLLQALPDLERRPFINVVGEDAGSRWIDSTGYFVGTFVDDLFGIPATGKILHLRYTEMLLIEDDKIRACYLIPDFLDAMRQAGVYPLRDSLGCDSLMLPPAALDGQQPTNHGVAYSEQSCQLVLDMLDCLREYDGVDLQSMDLARYWHEDFMWYGPGGIGTTRGIEGFRKHHQGPFLKGFPDRDVDDHLSTIACGDYIATGGWPHMHGTHLGNDWLGLPASNLNVEMRVMDIWRREGDRLRENWVAIDIPHILNQMGVDVFAHLPAG